jgi:hypothetical protein
MEMEDGSVMICSKGNWKGYLDLLVLRKGVSFKIQYVLFMTSPCSSMRNTGNILL